MKYYLLLLLIVVTFKLPASAQIYTPVTHLSGTQIINGNAVNVKPLTSASNTIYCGVGPYWIGNSGNKSSYTYSFSNKIYRFRIILNSSQIGEVISMYINGSKYNLTSSNLSSYKSTCQEGDLVASGGDLIVTTTSINSKQSAGAQIDIVLSSPADSLRLQHVSGQQNGSTYIFSYCDTNAWIKQPFTDTSLCVGDTMTVNYGVSSKFSGNNTFTLQLSNASGSFTSPTTLATVNSDTSGTMKWVVPSNATPGSNYRVRIVSTQPVRTTLDNGIDIAIGVEKVAKPIAGYKGSVCPGESLLLTASTTTSGVKYAWTGPNGFLSSMQNPTITLASSSHNGTYTVTAYKHGCKATDTIAVSALYTVKATSMNHCTNDTFKLFATPNTTNTISYKWTGPNGFVSFSQNPTIVFPTAAYSGKYMLQASNGKCVSLDTLDIVIYPPPSDISSSINSPICEGNTLNMTAASSANGVTYSWSGPGGFYRAAATASIPSATPSQNGDYYAMVTKNGCSLKDTVTALVKPLPNKPTAGNDIQVCAGSKLELGAFSNTSGVTYSWSGPDNFSTSLRDITITTATTTMTGDYIVVVHMDGCSNADTVTVLVKPTPSLTNAGSNTPICENDTLKLSIGTSTNGVTYSWSGPNSYTANTQNPTLSNTTPAFSGWYFATVDLNGCSFKDSTNVVVKIQPTTPVISYNNPVCLAQTLTLLTNNVTTGTYRWTGPNNFSANIQKPTRNNIQYIDTGIYSLRIIENGCSSSVAKIHVAANPQPFVVIFPAPDDTICTGQQVTFIALPTNHGGTPLYQWLVNGQHAGNGTVFSSSTLNNNDIVRCDMTEYTKCGIPYTDESNDVTMQVFPWLMPSVTFAANPNRPLTESEDVTFTATHKNAGAFPSFQWKRNGQNVIGATSNVWGAKAGMVKDNDIISVEVISSYRCPQPPTASSNTITVKILSGIADITAQSTIKVYPNPANDYVVFETISSQKKAIVSVTNITGQQVYNKELNTGKNIWHTGQLPAGAYIYKITVENQPIQIGKVIITR